MVDVTRFAAEPVRVTPLAVETDADVAHAFNRYAAAYKARDQAQTVLARYELCVRLVDTGWLPPPLIAEQMEADRAALGRSRVIQL